MSATVLVPLTAAVALPSWLVWLVVGLFAWYALSLEWRWLRDKRVMALGFALLLAAVIAPEPVYAVTIPCDHDYWYCLCVALLICIP